MSAAAMWPASVRPITAKEFAAFQQYIYAEAGIFLSEAKEALLVGRLSRRVRALELHTFTEYLEHVKQDAGERRQMIDAICTNETHFFREAAHFDFLRRQVLPRWIAEANRGARARGVRVWSAGCSTGEEPYSLAMLLLDCLGEGWSIEIVATDLSTRVLDAASEALWPLAKSSEIPEPYLRRFMMRGTRSQEGKMRARPELRRMVQFQQVNLNDEKYPVAGKFDLIFCRNVMIYFDAESKRKITDRLLDRLEPSGYFFIGHAESLNTVTTRTIAAMPTVYQLRAQA